MMSDFKFCKHLSIAFLTLILFLKQQAFVSRKMKNLHNLNFMPHCVSNLTGLCRWRTTM